MAHRLFWIVGLFVPLFLFSSFPTRAISTAYSPNSFRQGSEPVFALPGQLRPAQNQPFATYLITNDGTVMALVGQTPDLESQITSLRNQGPDTNVKVWGALYPNGRLSNVPEIVASDIKEAQPGTGASVPEPPAPGVQPVAVVMVGPINLRAEPSSNAVPVGQLREGDRCTIVGRDTGSSWWQVTCDNGQSGWVSDQFVTVEGDTGFVPLTAAAPTPTPMPTPTPPQSFAGWKSSYYSNPNLEGEPVAVEDNPDVNFNWGTGSPHPQVPPDHFSIRFERLVVFTPGNYRLSFTYDDGVRVWLDAQLILDDWQEGALRERHLDLALSGDHGLRIEYFQTTGNAAVRFQYAPLAAPGAWSAAYWNNPDLAGVPILERQETSGRYILDQDWGEGSPQPNLINVDNFSGSWTGRFNFEPGDYAFFVESDDGVRVIFDGRRIIDAWQDGQKAPTGRLNGVSGEHEVRVEYYERSGLAFIRLWWSRSSYQSGPY